MKFKYLFVWEHGDVSGSNSEDVKNELMETLGVVAVIDTETSELFYFDGEGQQSRQPIEEAI